MKALCVLYGGRLTDEAFEKVLPCKAVNSSENSSASARENAFSLALASSSRFPGVQKTVILGLESARNSPEFTALPQNVEALYRPSWNRKSLLDELSKISIGYDFIYFAWADCPLLDPALAEALAERHKRYGAEYSYADGWPYGFAPELLSHETAGILATLSDEGPVERDALFQVIQKDINAFDIETEISSIDLRHYRLTFAADSKRNLLLLSRLMDAGLFSASQAEKFISERPDLLRTLPAFFAIQVSGACPQACSLCPWPHYGGDAQSPVTGRSDFMSPNDFARLLDKISDFAGDAVIDLSLWGELALHPQKMELVQAVLSRPSLSLVIETSGIGWKDEELEALAQAASLVAPRKNHIAPLSWIVSLDAYDAERYKEVRGSGFSEARSCAKILLSLFPLNAYVQAVRVKGFEDDIERFYRSWKGEDCPQEALDAGRKDGGHIIIQKYDDFAGALPKLQASDLSPVRRRPCWHIQRDMNITLDGRVPCCREDLNALKGDGDKGIFGNALTDDLSSIWERGFEIYQEHCALEYKGICSGCDEYYTYNF